VTERWPTTWKTGYGAPPLSDKMFDWQLLADAGGQPLLFDKTVLEIGPGFGLDVLMHAHVTKRYVTLDTSHLVALDMLRWADLMGTPIESVEGNVLAIPATDETFDVVIDFSSIDNVAGDVWQAYGECARVLRVGGTLITSFSHAGIGGKTHSLNSEHYLDPGDLIAFLSAKGFECFAPRGVVRAGLYAKKVGT